MKFENTFWTSDYISGIKAFLHSLEKSHNEGQNSLEYFKSYVDLLEVQSVKFKELSLKSDKMLKNTSIEEAAPPLKVLSEFQGNHGSLGSVTRLKRAQVEYTNLISEIKSSVSSKLESDVIMILQDFLEDYSDFISDSKKSLTNQYNTYTKTNQHSLAAERTFINKTRELEDVKLEESPTTTAEEVPEEKIELKPELNVDTDDPDDEIFNFPLQMGTTVFANIEALKDFMAKMTREVPVKRRLISIPGINNEYFSSESFFKWVKSNRENEDSRRKIEKFGQDMITLGLINNWNKLAPNKFASDEGYYEFTDLARYIAKFGEQKIPALEVTPSQESKVTQTPTRVVSSGVFDGLKNKFKSNDVETLKQNAEDAKKKYLDAVDKSYLEKEKLESVIQSITRRAEVFETNRIKLIYGLTRQFNELVLQEQQKQLDAFQEVHDGFIYNEETLKYELMKKSVNNKAAWYWPKSEIKFSNYGNSKTTASSEILGNDLLNQYRDISNEEPKTKTVPFFLRKLIENLNELEGLNESWSKEIDIVKANEIKRLILLSTPEFEKQYDVNGTAVDINKFVTTKIIADIITKYSTDEVVSFFKLWLLELPDSIVPFTSFDQLKSCYEKDSEDEIKLKVLGSIPRQNLASLLLIFQHLSSKVSDVEKLIKNERVPLYHLFIRPSPKISHASIDDVVNFKPFCYDMIKPEFQEELYKKLDELEQMHLEREKRAEDSLNRLKQAPRELSPPVSTIPKSTSNNALTVDGLRPFKTKSPLASPVTSPKIGRSRANSNLTPKIRRPSDSLHKRTFSKNIDKEISKGDEKTESVEQEETIKEGEKKEAKQEGENV